MRQPFWNIDENFSLACCLDSTVLLAYWLSLPVFPSFRSTLRRVDARSIPVIGCSPSRLSSSRTTCAPADPARAETRRHERTIAHQPYAEGNVSRTVSHFFEGTSSSSGHEMEVPSVP